MSMTRHWSGHTKTCTTKEGGVLSVFENKYGEKREKNTILVCPGIQISHSNKKKCLFEYENNLRLKNNTKTFSGLISNFCRCHEKSASHTFSIYEKILIMQFSVLMELHGKCMISTFPYMKIVWLAFLGNPYRIYYIF